MWRLGGIELTGGPIAGGVGALADPGADGFL